MMSGADLSKCCIAPEATIRQAMVAIDGNRNGIVLVVDRIGKLVGTITDGDIRRFMLKGRSFDEPCATVMWVKPLTAPVTASGEELRALLASHRLRNVPLVDEQGRAKGLVSLNDLIPQESGGRIAVVMAGGEGKRLRPLTENIPKPMVEVGGKPILETTVGNLASSGVAKVYLAVNYRAEVIEDHFGDGSRWGVEINYLREKTKLGTAGALSLLPEVPSEPILVMNGDVVTNVNLARFLEFHRHHRCVMCVAASEYHINIPLGVLNLAGHYVLGVEEKPAQRFLCNAGIYMINPELLRFVPSGKHYDMTDLLRDVVREGLPIAAFPILEYWVDVGQEEDLLRAQKDIQTGLKDKRAKG